QELEEGRETPVPFRAPVVHEAVRALDVMSEQESPAADGTCGRIGDGRRRRGGPLVDRAKQLDGRPRRELRALEGVEPDRLATEADVERHLAFRAAREHLPAHRRAASRAVVIALLSHDPPPFRPSALKLSECAAAIFSTPTATLSRTPSAC